MASRDKGLHSSPPAPSASPPRPQGTTDMGLLGISSFRDMPASLFVSSVCLWLLLLSGCVWQTGPADSLKHPLSHISEHSASRGPFISLPNSTSCPKRQESPQEAYKNSRSPHNVAAAERTPAFYRKDIVSHILPCPQHRLNLATLAPPQKETNLTVLLHRHVPGGARLPT